MSTAESVLQHYRKLGSKGGSQPWVHPRQQAAIEALQQLELPHRREETWRYTPLPPILQQTFKPAEREDGLLSAENINEVRLTDGDNPRIVLLNGHFMADVSTLPDNDSIEIRSLRDALSAGDKRVFEHLGQLGGENPHLFNTLNTAAVNDGAYIRVKQGVKLEQPIELIHICLSFDGGFLAQPRTLVIVEDGAEAMLLENYASLADISCLHNHVIEVFVGEGATLNHPRLQNESQQSRHLTNLYVEQAANSQYHSTTIALGGQWSRTELHNDFAAEGAECHLKGFYLAGDQQSHDIHLDVMHSVPNCNSSEQFKGILYGKSKAVFDGNIEVKIDAQKTDARLSNDNLLLSRDAEIDTKPRLEIYADDVQCSHGTTVGQIDPDMLFYLRARGIPKKQAIKLICLGFAGEVVASCNWAPLQERVDGILAKRLEQVAQVTF